MLLIRALIAVLTVALALAVSPSVAALECAGVALDDGCLFTITGGDTPDPDDGYAVTNADDVPLWDFVRERDLQAIGYPISQRWMRGPFALQAFQKVILQWDSGKQRMNYYNTLDVLANRYPEVELPNVPPHQVLEADRGADVATITRNHLALLDQNAEIKERFLREPDWLNLYGLPISYEEQEVNGHPQGLQMLRAQRTVFVIWNVPAPGTTIGRVNLQNVPDKVKKLSNVIIPDAAEAPLFAHAVAQLPVFSLTLPDPIPPTQVSLPVGELAQRNRRLQPYVDQMPWLADYVFPWLTDGITAGEYATLDKLTNVAHVNDDLAIFIAGVPWFENGFDYDSGRSREFFVMSWLSDISRKSHELLEIVLSYTWLADDDIVLYDSEPLHRLRELANHDLELAFLLAQAPWFVDGIKKIEFRSIDALLDLNRTHPDLARQLLSYSLEPPVWDSDVIFIEKIWDLLRTDPDCYHKLVHQLWYTNGLTLEERAFINRLSCWSDVIDELLETHSTQSAIVTLPLAGDVRLWAFQLEPFPAGEDVLGMVAEAVQGVERFLRQPFHLNTVTVKLVGKEDAPLGFRAIWGESGMILVRDYFPHLDRNDPADRNVVYHETAHAIFGGLGPYHHPRLANPPWITEGGANFLTAYINDLEGFQSLEDRLHLVSIDAQRTCIDEGIGNIQRLTIPNSLEHQTFRRCSYILGEYLFLRLYFAIGENGLSAAVRELHWLATHVRPDRNAQGISTPTDLQVFQIFLKHTPPGREDAVRDAYRRIHGGFTADPSFKL